MVKRRIKKRKQIEQHKPGRSNPPITSAAVPHAPNTTTDQEKLTVCIETGEGTRTNEVPPAFPADVMLGSDDSQAVAALKKMWGSIEKKKTAPLALTPAPVQLQSWSVMLNHTHNLIAIAPTGSGKTLGYGLGMLASCRATNKGIQGVCLVPTRELARQVEKELKVPARALSIRLACVYGGQDRDYQIQALHQAKRCGVVVVATPGRLVDLLEERSDLRKMCSGVKFLVIDEADILAKNVDSCEQIESIRKTLPPDVRTCLFSATKIRSVSKKWDEWVAKPRAVIKVDNRTFGRSEPSGEESSEARGAAQPVETTAKKRKLGGTVDAASIPAHVTQTLRVCSAAEKTKELLSTISTIRQGQAKRNPGLTIVFFARIKNLQSVLKLLVKEGIQGCSEYHGQMSQAKREKALAGFRSGKSTILLATDIAARGIHVKNLEYVINYDFPDSLEQYVHRCGRAGRIQKDGTRANGTVYSFFTKDLAPLAKQVVDILRTTNSWLDPNLMVLAESE